LSLNQFKDLHQEDDFASQSGLIESMLIILSIISMRKENKIKKIAILKLKNIKTEKIGNKKKKP
jgi:hypothetical protein